MILVLPILVLRVVPYVPTIVLPFPSYQSWVLYGQYSCLPGERICIDLKHLNSSVKRAHYQLPTIDNTLGHISGARYFLTLDAASGFWQVPLDPKFAPLTTFSTPFGRFYFNRLPFGITSAPEIFQQRISDLLDSIPNVMVFMDDILVFGSTEAEHDATLTAVKKALADADGVLNPTKCHLKQTSVKFLEHTISADGITPGPSKVAAITALPASTNVAELHRALVMFNFLAKFLPDMASVSAPLRVLFKSDSVWVWEEPQSTAFCALQHFATSAPCLVPFSTERAIRISADASSYGLGAVLLQPDGPAWRPVAYASRSLTEAEGCYTHIEKECLAVIWACEHFHNYVYGGPQFIVETDHKPLVPLINSKPYAPTIVLPFSSYHSWVLYRKYSCLPGELRGLLCVLSVSFLTKHIPHATTQYHQGHC